LSSSFTLSDGTTTLTLYPEWDYSHARQMSRSQHRMQTGALKAYRWAAWDEFEYSLEYISRADAEIINNWWLNRTLLIYTQVIDAHTISTRVRIGGDTTPLPFIYSGNTTLKRGKVLLEAIGPVQDFTQWFMFMTWDHLQPVEGTDYLDDGLTITHTGVSAVEEDHRIVGTGCLELGAGDYTEITGSATILDAAIKNIGTYFFPTDTNDETFKVLEVFDDEDTSLLIVSLNTANGALTVGGQAATGTFASNQYWWMELYESSGNYALKMNGSTVSLASSVAVPTGCTRIVLGVSTAETPTDRIYLDNTMLAK
jgi:hypothetical protein